jgi:LPXTG-site transpeptidase (sortase) family protein
MNDKEEKFFTDRDKTLFKVLFFVFLISVLVLNWKDISWFLNLNTAPELFRQKVGEIVLTYKEKRAEKIEEVIEEEEEEEIEEIDSIIYCEENRITISVIDITAPVVETGGTTEKEYREALDRGVIHFPGTPYPGEAGMTVLLGHSAPSGWPKIKHDWVFTKINDLKVGDEVEICYNNVLTVYTIVDDVDGKRIYEVGEDVPPLYDIREGKKEAVLMSCWPPGSSESRIGVRAVVK